MTEAPKTKSFWFDELDGLRTLAFLLVFYSHTTGLFWRTSYSGTNQLYVALLTIDRQVKSWGWIGVDLFFVLSAFLITTILLNERKRSGRVDLKNFLTRRALRIWPLYFFYLAVVFFSFPHILAWQTSLGLAVEPDQLAYWREQLLAYCFFVGNYSMIVRGELVTPLNPLWSLCIEEQFYVVWGLTMTLVKRDRNVLILTLVALFGVIALRAVTLFGHPTTHLSYYLGAAHTDGILLGVVCAFIWRRWGEKIKQSSSLPAVLATTGAVTTGGVILIAPGINSRDLSLTLSMFLVNFGWACVLLATLSLAPLKRFFASPLLTHIGRLTYGMYIFHFMVIYLLLALSRQYLAPQVVASQTATIALLWGAGLTITYICARLSARFIEGPFIKLKSKF